jgi:hypothetical protein
MEGGKKGMKEERMEENKDRRKENMERRKEEWNE